jgi:hypothetical protein
MQSRRDIDMPQSPARSDPCRPGRRSTFCANLILLAACGALIGGPIGLAIAEIDRDASDAQLEWLGRASFIPYIPPLPAANAPDALQEEIRRHLAVQRMKEQEWRHQA